MRRLLLVALAVAWLVATGVSFESGRRAERHYRAAVEALGEDASLEVAIERYDRGIFASEVETIVEPRSPGAAMAATARLVLLHRIDHGPYPFSYVRSDDFDGQPIVVRATTTPTVEIETDEAIEEIPLPVSITALFTRDDGATLWMVPDPALIEEQDPELSGDWEDVYAETWFSYDASSFSGELEIPRIEFESEDGAFRLIDFLYEFEYDRVATGPAYVGGSRLRIGRLAVEGEGGGLSLHDFEFEDSSEASGGVWSLQVDGSLGELRGDDRRWRNGELALRVGGLALEPLAELRSLGEGIEGADASNPVVQAELMGAATASWPKLMAPSPEIELSRLRLETPNGEFRMGLRLGVDASEPALLVHPLMTFPALELDAELMLPEATLHDWLAVPRPVAEISESEASVAPWVAPAEMAVQRIETWLERGFIERQDGQYRLSVRVRQGTVRLNGRIVSFDAL